ncbi:MAG TPA: M48 family metalloprotease [Beijerinckiaceae bacterium]|nr:M48 family metalloprotease [Beijerinckiaceae bacterium]
MRAFGLYTHIAKNRRRSAVLLAGLFFLVYLVAYAVAVMVHALDAGEPDLGPILRGALADMIWLAPIATVAAGLWILIAYRINHHLVDRLTGAAGLERSDAPRLYDLLEALCISRGMAVPRLKILETPALNAYASGLNPKQYGITVTRGLLEALDDAELEAVLAHELTHIRNEDARMMVIAVVVAGAVSLFAELVFRGVIRPGRITWRGGSGGNRRGGGAGLAILVALALIALAWLLSLVIRFALSRSREYLADSGAVELTKNPDAMISALLKIQGRSRMEGVPSGIMEMCIDYPRQGFSDIFATHPPIERRVDALVRYAGGRLPPPEPPALPEPPEPGPEPPAGPWGERPQA